MSDEKKSDGLKNGLKSVRLRLGLSQSELAQAAGVARQTIGGIEATLYAPSAMVALRLAKALGCRVEDIFWLANEPSGHIEARLAVLNRSQDAVFAEETRAVVGRVGAHWVAHALEGDGAFSNEMRPADSLIEAELAPQNGRLRLLENAEMLENRVLLAGCSPAFSLWLNSARRWHPALHATWLHANSTQSLESLARGEIHIAGVHLRDAPSGEENAPFVRRALGENAVLVVLGRWEEGFLLARGNPKKVRGVEDLTRPDVRFLNRECGAGTRLLLDNALDAAKIPHNAVNGYATETQSHQAVARSVASGQCDAAISTSALAKIYGLDFLPLQSVRFDLAMKSEFLELPGVSQLLETLGHRAVRAQLRELGGYDTAPTGELLRL